MEVPETGAAGPEDQDAAGGAEQKPGRGKKVKAVEPDLPTAPRDRDENNRPLDHWGLPMNGPARVARLAELGRNDPITHPDEWPTDGLARSKS